MQETLKDKWQTEGTICSSQDSSEARWVNDMNKEYPNHIQTQIANN